LLGKKRGGRRNGNERFQDFLQIHEHSLIPFEGREGEEGPIEWALGEEGGRDGKEGGEGGEDASTVQINREETKSSVKEIFFCGPLSAFRDPQGGRSQGEQLALRSSRRRQQLPPPLLLILKDVKEGRGRKRSGGRRTKRGG
jgi:hypothetical protein